jgi:hypothetical protein
LTLFSGKIRAKRTEICPDLNPDRAKGDAALSVHHERRSGGKPKVSRGVRSAE